VVQQLQAAVFGEASLQRGFTECVYLASLAQVRRHRRRHTTLATPAPSAASRPLLRCLKI
jgi:hypothetical protein